MGEYVWVAAGGAMGATLRYGIQGALLSVWPGFPAGTMLVNLVGSFLVGLLMCYLPQLPEFCKPLLIGGFLGALTTMSAYALDVNVLVQEKRLLAAGLFWLSGSLVCLVFCWLGLVLGGRLSG